jgi:hypothetical protein
MVVRPPKCKTCGKIEWQHVCQGIGQPSIGRQYSRAEIATPAKRADRPVKTGQPSAMAQAIERINELEAEVKVLKRALAEAHGKLATKNETVIETKNETIYHRGRPRTGTAMTTAERLRRFREKRKVARAEADSATRSLAVGPAGAARKSASKRDRVV